MYTEMDEKKKNNTSNYNSKSTEKYLLCKQNT